jgi:hypothetical protein
MKLLKFHDMEGGDCENTGNMDERRTQQGRRGSLTAIIALIGLLACPLQADEAFDHSHHKLDTLLNKHVNKQGLVNYSALLADRADLDAYLDSLSKVSRQELSTWTRDQKLAFWSNAYNAFTLKHIIDHYPIQRSRSLKARLYPANSIRQIDGVWDELENSAGGRSLTLSEIEHTVLRKELKDPRVHFVIVCASIGCPLLADHAYSAPQLQEQFDEAAKAFIRNPDKVRVDSEDGVIYLSKIFDWFKEDFDDYTSMQDYGKYNGVMSFVSQHLTDADKASLDKSKFKIKWLDYDWSLNEQ